MADLNEKLKLIHALNKEQGRTFDFDFVSEGTKGWKIYE